MPRASEKESAMAILKTPPKTINFEPLVEFKPIIIPRVVIIPEVNPKEKPLKSLTIGLRKKGGELIALSGDLGAGKTAFTKGIAHYFKIKQRICSPTFVFMKVYDIPGNKLIKKLVHVDAYRIENSQNILSVGLQEYIGDKNVVTIIEWPENIEKFLPKNSVKINIEHRDENLRQIEY